MTEQLFKIYSIDKYAGKTQKFIDNNFDELNLRKIQKILLKENGYHLRINPNKEYIFFGDCDGFRGTFEEFL